MSTLKVASINNPSASSGGLAISAAGNVTGAGLDLITTQSFTAVSSVSINNCFSGDYDNYLVLVSFTAFSTTLTASLKMRAGGTDTSANYNRYVMFGTGAAAGSTQNIGAASWTLITSDATYAPYNRASIDLFSPNANVKTTATYQIPGVESGGVTYTIHGGLFHAVDTVFDGLTLLASTGNMSGAVSVYGYKK